MRDVMRPLWARAHLAVATKPERESPPARLPGAPARPGSDRSGRARRRVDLWLVAALLVTGLALALRVTGLGYGLPFHYHWDEPTIMNRVIRMGGGDLNPHFFYYPTLLMYVLLVLQGGLYAAGRVLHYYSSPDAFAVAYLTNSTASYLVGRALVATLGAATVLLTFIVGRRFLSAPAGLIGALILAVSPVHIGSSHFVTNDVPMAFFALLSYVFLWDVYRRGLARDYLLSGVVVGLGTATKYLPFVLLLSIALAHAFRLRNETGRWSTVLRGWPWLVAAGAAAFAAFAVASPYVLLDWRSAIHDYAVQGSLSGAAGCSDCQLNFFTYLGQTMPWAIGWPAYLLALVGLASLSWTRGEKRLRWILLASFPVLLFLMVGSERQPWPRWLVPVAPFAGLAAGAIAWWLIQRFGRTQAPWAARAMSAAVVVLLAVPPAIASTRFDLSLLQPDPRTQTAEWFQSSVPDGTAVAVQPLLDRYFFTAQIPTDTSLADIEGWVPQSKPAVRSEISESYHRQHVYREAPFTYDVAALRARGVRYVVLSSAHYHNVDPAAEDRFYAELARSATVVKRFQPLSPLPDADQYPVSKPTITVYELPSPPA
jgi:hypothetical protein